MQEGAPTTVRPTASSGRHAGRPPVSGSACGPADRIEASDVGTSIVFSTADTDTEPGEAYSSVRIQRAFPGLHVALVEVPFPLYTRCLPERQVDVLLTIDTVRHREVESFPLLVTSARIGVVSARHPLAGATELDVARFCEHSLLHNPAVPDEWMRPFWLADVRPRAEARLTVTHGSNSHRVLRHVQSGSAALVTLSPDHHALPPGLQGVALAGAEPLTFYAARRRRDRRTVVHAYVELLRTLGPRNLQ